MSQECGHWTVLRSVRMLIYVTDVRDLPVAHVNGNKLVVVFPFQDSLVPNSIGVDQKWKLGSILLGEFQLITFIAILLNVSEP